MVGFHFDMAYHPDTIFQLAHPIFHAQLDFGAVNTAAIDHPCSQTETAIKNPFPRLPTPPMDMPSVVFLVLSDHLGRALLRWPGGVAGAVRRLPRLPDWPVTEATIGKGQLEIMSWYGDPATPPRRAS